MIDSNRDLYEGSEQYNWLEWELSKSTAMWKIAMHHHPPYTSDSNDYGDTAKELSNLGSKSRNFGRLLTL
jgi:phosphodiesterase/alkaline phosphatase D-like protein